MLKRAVGIGDLFERGVTLRLDAAHVRRGTSGDSLEPAMPTGPGIWQMQWKPWLSSAYGWRGLCSSLKP